jgi:excisionase family DNA binding protein
MANNPPPLLPGQIRPLLTVAEVGELLRLSPRAIRRLIADGRLPVVRLGHAIRIRPEVVEELIASRGQARTKDD